MKILGRALIALGLLCLCVLMAFYIYYSNVFKVRETRVPHVDQMELAEAIKEIEDVELKYEVIYVVSKEEKIIYTHPYAGCNVKVGSKVTLYVGCREKEGIPNVTFLKKEDAVNILQSKQITYEMIEVETNDYEDGLVYQQEILEGNILRLYISKKKESQKIPSMVGMYEEEALAILKSLKLNYIFNYEESIFPSGMVIYSDIEGITEIGEHNESLITLTIAK